MSISSLFAVPLPSTRQFLARGCVECARTVFSQLLAAFASSQTLWIKAVQLEKQHGTRTTLDAILAQAVLACPQSDTLWLMGAKEKWLAVRCVCCLYKPDFRCRLLVVGRLCSNVLRVIPACTVCFTLVIGFMMPTGTQEG